MTLYSKMWSASQYNGAFRAAYGVSVEVWYSLGESCLRLPQTLLLLFSTLSRRQYAQQIPHTSCLSHVNLYLCLCNTTLSNNSSPCVHRSPLPLRERDMCHGKQQKLLEACPQSDSQQASPSARQPKAHSHRD